MFGLFGKKVKKEEFEQHKGAVQTALNKVKQDFSNVTKWIKHLDKEGSLIKNEISDIYEEISSIKDELGEIKEMLAFGGNPGLFKQRQTAVGKQTAVYTVQNSVQTPVQTAFLDNLSASERALILILLNSEMKLSYEDLAAMMGKESATVRGQINSIKQKCSGLIEEQIEKNNKKRLYIPEKVRNTILKKVKVRAKKGRKNEEIE